MDDRADQLLKDYRDAVESSHEARCGYGADLNQVLARQEIVERNIDDYLAKPKDGK